MSGSADASGAPSEESSDANRRRGRGRDRLRRDRRPDGHFPAGDGGDDGHGEGETSQAQERSPASHETHADNAPERSATEVGTTPSWQSTEGEATPSWGNTDDGSTTSLRGAEGAVAISPPAPYVLPLEDLHRIAQDSGLQWVNSDADKIAAAQAAIAAEPKPVHVPREPKPPVVIDEGPLILVETRKDLSQVKLPFEN